MFTKYSQILFVKLFYLTFLCDIITIDIVMIPQYRDCVNKNFSVKEVCI